jgi:hypothetical protein
MKAEIASEAEDLQATSAIALVWYEAIRKGAPEQFIEEIEMAIAFEAKNEWGNDTVVDFDRKNQLMSVEHPEKGIKGFGKMEGLKDLRLPLVRDPDDGEFYYDWSAI